MAACRFYWDFYGPHGERTAAHFLEHLRGFLLKESLDLPTTTANPAEGHHCVSCDLPELPLRMQQEEGENLADRVGAALRPNRLESLED